MTEIHFKYSVVKNNKTLLYVPRFKCCDTHPVLVDILSHSDITEFVSKKCPVCSTQYKEETVFGKPSAGYPHITTFTY